MPKVAQLQLAAGSKDCPIRTPKEYRDEWDKLATPGIREMPGCVSQNLYGSVYECGSPTLYGETAEKAWIFGKVNLEQLMHMQWKFGHRNASVVTAASLVIIGFGPPALSFDLEGFCLAVFTLPSDAVALVPAVPTVTYWFNFMSQQGFSFDDRVQQGLTQAYSGGMVGKTVLDVFQKLTNCSEAALKQDPLPANGQCSTSSFAVYTALEEEAGQGTKGCVNKFWMNTDNAWSLTNIGDVRMMLFRCFDANPFNTFVGSGWNSYPNPLVCKQPRFQTSRDHYTGKEFVIDNRPIQEFKKHTSITLATAEKESNDFVQKRGFCW